MTTDFPMYACLYLPPRSIINRTQTNATKALVDLARRHSPRVELHGQRLVVLDVRGMERLWGSPSEIGALLRRAAADQGLLVQVAVAATRMAVRAVSMPLRQPDSAFTVATPRW